MMKLRILHGGILEKAGIAAIFRIPKKDVIFSGNGLYRPIIIYAMTAYTI